MLEQLDITNYVLISHLSISFSSGLSVLSGETGAGKSVILSAIALILGEKAKADVVRRGESEAHINAVFSYGEKDAGLRAFLEREDLTGEDDTIIISRTIRAGGRSVNRVNSRIVTRETLSALGAYLIDISSQAAHQGLLKNDVQRVLLDRFSDVHAELEAYEKAFRAYQAAESELNELKEKSERARRDYDYFSFCLEELDKADLKEGEDDVLGAELKRISLSEALTEEVSASYSILKGDIGEGALTLLSHALSSLNRASSRDPGLDELARRLESCEIEAEDIAASLRDYLSSLTFSERELEEKNARMSLLQRMKKKYGPSLSDAIKKREEFREALLAVDNADELLSEKEKQLAKCASELERCASALTEKRRKGASRLEEKTISILKKLSMQSAELSVMLEKIPYCQHGQDKVEFLIRANKGEKRGAIRDVASGGELSRILLALKAALSEEDETGTLIFDEVDSGIGGAVATAVGEEISALSKSHQVLVITHSAQIAARADVHFLVSKREEGERTFSEVRKIDGEGRIKEIARLLSGKTSDSALVHARELLEV
ncbi:MAG: DNA repair protein RecN [Spirochaetales bacterium]|nr:DNA repair protein RecN [Spirochaetales bacterium]